MAEKWIQKAREGMERKGTVGSFRAAAKKHGKSTAGFASQVMAHKDKYSSTLVKRANFARNVSK